MRRRKNAVRIEKPENSLRLKWKRGYVGLPSAFVRSALFRVHRGSASNSSEHIARPVRAISAELTVEGPELDQYDRLVFCTVLQLCWQKNILGDGDITEKHFFKHASFQLRIGAALRVMGEAKNKSIGQAQSFFRSIERLASVYISLRQQNLKFSGNLLDFEIVKQKNEKIGCSTVLLIKINPNIDILFKDGLRTELNWNVLRAMKRNQIALWLYGFYSSFPPKTARYYKLQTLAELMGLCVNEERAAHRLLVGAFDALDHALGTGEEESQLRVDVKCQIVDGRRKQRSYKIITSALYSEDIDPNPNWVPSDENLNAMLEYGDTKDDNGVDNDLDFI